MLSSYDKYLAGIPLNEELAAVKEGVQDAKQQPATPIVPPIEDPDRDLTITELVALKELMWSPGWPVLQRLLQKAFQTHKNGAISLSQINPLGNQVAIAEQWAYVTMFKRATVELEALVNGEVIEFDRQRSGEKR